MRISQITGINRIQKTSYETQSTFRRSDRADSFTRYNCNNPISIDNVSFKGGFFGSIFSVKDKHIQDNVIDENVSEFQQQLALGVNKFYDSHIAASRFKNILSGQDVKELLPSLSQENFEYTPENMENGTYCADMDYQSNFSNGTESVYNILDDVSSYANRFYRLTGKDFIFALTDRDSLNGVQHAIRIIGENPQKFAHVKFIPGIKMSFAHMAPNSSDTGFENSEMLVYGINPYSDNLNKYINSTVDRRKEMCVEFIKQVSRMYPEFAYDIKEFTEQNELKYRKDFTVSNLYWRAREYAEQKGGSSIYGAETSAAKIIDEAQDIIDSLDIVYVGSNLSDSVSTCSEIIKNKDINKNIKAVFDLYTTHKDEEKSQIVSKAENLYDEMIECLNKEPGSKPVLSLSAPYYFSHYYKDKPNNASKKEESYQAVVKFIKHLSKRSEGMLLAFESVVPSYGLDIVLGDETVRKFNDYIRNKLDLYETGGSFHKTK